VALTLPVSVNPPLFTILKILRAALANRKLAEVEIGGSHKELRRQVADSYIIGAQHRPRADRPDTVRLTLLVPAFYEGVS